MPAEDVNANQHPPSDEPCLTLDTYQGSQQVYEALWAELEGNTSKGSCDDEEEEDEEDDNDSAPAATNNPPAATNNTPAGNNSKDNADNSLLRSPVGPASCPG
ncbi:hypothetical protein V8E53_002633 [Lactarius tabidus]